MGEGSKFLVLLEDLGFQAVSPLCGQRGGSCWAPPSREQLLALWLSLLPGWGQCLWSFAQCGWRGSSAAPGTDGDGSALLEGSPGATGGGRHFQAGWLWGDLTLGVHIRFDPVCAGVISVGSTGSGWAQPQECRLSVVRAPLGPAWLCSARSLIPSSPYMEIFPAAGRARCSPESCRGLGEPAESLEGAGPGGAAGSSTWGNPSAPALHSSWTSQPGSPVPTGAASPCVWDPHSTGRVPLTLQYPRAGSGVSPLSPALPRDGRPPLTSP